MKNAFALVPLLLALAGCTSMTSVPAAPETLKPYQGQPLTIVTYKKPDFPAMTQKLAMAAVLGSMGGILGGNIALNNGNAIAEQNGLADPARDISAALSPQVQAALKPSSVNNATDLDPKESDQAPFFKLAGNSGVIFDVQTVSWQILYLPANTDHYRVMLAIRARLIDGNWGTRLAQAPCTYQSDDKDAPTYDEMLANHAARLKAMLAAAKDSCAATLQKALFGK